MADMTKEQIDAADEAQKAAELAYTNITRFLDLQASRESALIMKAHQQDLEHSGKAAQAAAQLAALNIRRFLDLQTVTERALIMRAHHVEGAKGGHEGGGGT